MFMTLAMPKRLIIKAVTVIDDNNINVIYKSNNKCTQKTRKCYDSLAVITLLTVLLVSILINT